jgi:hypothetical protein
MVDKISSKVLFAALLNKYRSKQAAVLGEVTMEDEEEQARYRTWNVLLRPQNKKIYDSKGLRYDSELPDNYRPLDSTLVRRIDALIFEGQQRTAVEIKISRADFFRDTLEKRSAWMRHTDRFVYLTPKGLIKVDEVPEGCGLWEYDVVKRQIIVVKKSKLNKNVKEFPPSMVKYFAWRAFIAEGKIGRHR